MTESLLTADALVKLALGVIALGVIVTGWFKVGLPALRDRRHRDRSVDDVMIGRPEIPANPITGEPARPEILPIGVRLDQLGTLLLEIHHELHPNGGSSMKDAVGRVESQVATMSYRLDSGNRRFDDIDADLKRIKLQIGGELSTATGALAHAAEASTAALRTIETAILADPPSDL